jgi:BirA family biotin operon repressor/biotin-[acetyl-CoA-carboxylase] ligase
MNITVLTFDSLASTNTEALEQARKGADEGLCVIARQQTSGRGRHGRVWSSPKDAGLYFSIVLRPRLENHHLPLITLTAGVAVHDVLQEFGLSPDIKWVNDVLVGEKKISGILAETADTGQGISVVVGVGINLRSGSFPPEIAATATSIEDASGLILSPEEATGSLVKFLLYFYEILSGPGGPEEIINEWRKRSTYFSGKSVRVALGEEVVTGETDGLEANGALRIRHTDSSVTIVQAGDVERLRAEAIGNLGS